MNDCWCQGCQRPCFDAAAEERARIVAGLREAAKKVGALSAVGAFYLRASADAIEAGREEWER